MIRQGFSDVCVPRPGPFGFSVQPYSSEMPGPSRSRLAGRSSPAPSLAPVYGLQSESSPALHLPTSPLLESLIEDVNSALAKFVEDQTVHSFIPIPSRRHWKYYRTSSSFPGPYSVPPGLASITLDRASETKKRSVSFSHSQVSVLETLLSSVCEVMSWLDWWLSTCGGFREHLSAKSVRTSND